MFTQSTNAGAAMLLVMAAACWGVATVISKSVLSQVPPLTLLVAQLAVSAAFLWSLLLRRVPLSWGRPLLMLSLLGWLNPGLAYTFGLLGLTLTTASLSTLLWAVEPVLILGLAWLILRERLTRYHIALSLLALAGVGLITGTTLSAAAGSLLGNALVLAGVFCCAMYTVLTRRLGADLDPLLVVTLQQTVALLWSLLIWPVAQWPSGWVSLLAISGETWLWIALSGLLYYALAFWLYVLALRHVPAGLAGAFLNLIPLFGIGSAHLFLDERLSPEQWIGAALILMGVLGLWARPLSSDQSPAGSSAAAVKRPTVSR